MRRRLTDVLHSFHHSHDRSTSICGGEVDSVATKPKRNNSRATIRRRAQSEHADYERAAKHNQELQGSPRARSRTLSSWTSSGQVQRWLPTSANKSIHAIDVNVLGSLSVPDQDEAPGAIEPEQVTVERCLSGESDEASCLICMGKATRKKPLITIPCSEKCNLAPVHAKCIYEWKEQKKGKGTCPLCRSELEEINYSPPDILRTQQLVVFSLRKQFVYTPVPRPAGTVRCYVKVRNGFWGSPTSYELYLQAPSICRYPGGPLPDEQSPHSGDVLLMVARKRLNKWGCSQIDISMDVNSKDYSQKSQNYLGMVQANLSGLEHTLLVPFKSNVHGSNAGGYRELAAIHYSQNRIGSASGPRRMHCILPQVEVNENIDNCDENTVTSEASESINLCDNIGIPVSNTSTSMEDYDGYSSDESDDEMNYENYSTKLYRASSKYDTLSATLRKYGNNTDGIDKKNFIVGHNKEPYWLETIHAYSLDFSGRVTLPSNKNFQLQLDGKESEDINLQFGKVLTTDETSDFCLYTLDFSFPLSPLQAFGFALSSCDRKLACA